MLDISNTSTFKTKEEIRKMAPSIFTEKAAKNTSEHYNHFPTYKIIDDMELLGWKVVDAKEVKARKQVGHQKHLIVFRNEDIVIKGKGKDNDDVFPQILLTNSSDGKNAFTFTAGLFRMVCENGLVISTDEFSNIKMRHMGYNFEQLQLAINGIVEKLPLTVESMNKFKQIELDQEQILDFAKQALESRFGDDMENMEFDYEELIRPTRKEDVGNDLWRVFNNLQEKVMGGDFNYTTGVKTRKARKIKNFNQDINVNAKLWSVAESFCLIEN